MLAVHPTTTTTSKKPRLRPARCSRPAPTTACRTSRPPTTRTRWSSPPTPPGQPGPNRMRPGHRPERCGPGLHRGVRAGQGRIGRHPL